MSAQPPCVWLSTTFAGSGIASFANDQGTAASFKNPAGVAAHDLGVVFVADFSSNRIRAVSPTGTVTTPAGNGTAAWADGIGTAVCFDGPRGVATYPGSVFIFIADTYNNRIRVLTPSGVTTTLAGSSGIGGADGLGSSASFYGPYGLTVDSTGLIYVADAANNRVRKVTPQGYVTTLASTLYPTGVAVDGVGNIYVASTGKRVNLIFPNGTVSIFAGNGGLKNWADGQGTSAAFYSPNHLSIAPNGNVFVADTFNHRIRMITPLGLVTTISGSTSGFLNEYGTASRFSQPIGISVSSNYTVYVGDNQNSRIRALTCELCPAFFECTSGAPKRCAAGSLCPYGSFYEVDCPAGSFCPDQTFSTLCPAGSFCPARSVSPQLCPPGSYTSVSGRSACILCGPGLLSPNAGSTLCDDFCPIGTYRARPGGANDSSCTLCPPGTFGEAEGATSCTPCPVGSAGGTAAGANSSATCTPCSPGSFSASLTGAAVCSACLPGTFAAAGASACTSCPSGRFSGGGGSACLPCPLGSATSAAGSTSCTNCSAGFYADASGAPQCTPCPRGRYSNAQAQASSGSCSLCAAGTYNPFSGQTSGGCISCSPGRYSGSAGAGDAALCSPCAPGSTAPTSGSTLCTVCQPGTYASVDATSCLSCPIGMRGASAGGTSLTSACAACAAGSFAPTSGSTSCTSCSAGSYADAPGSSSCILCPSGTFSDFSSSASLAACQPCPGGTFNPSQGQTSSGCISCPPGTASFASGASALSQCSPCGAGTFASLAGSSNCSISPAGSFSAPPPGGATGATAPTQCPLGTFSGILGAVSVTQCTACPAGKTTASAGAMQDTQCLALPFSCPPGQQPRLASASTLADCAPLTCPAPLRPSAFVGYASDAQALPQSLSCLGCASGTLGSVPACAPCDSASFCPGFTSRPLYNFSADAAGGGAPRALAQGSGTPTSPFLACPVLVSLTKSASPTTLASAATSTIFFGVPLPTTSSQSLLAWVVIFFWLAILSMLIAFSRTSENATGFAALPLRALKAVDLFSMAHKVEDRSSPIKEATPLGGLFSLMGLTTLLTYASYMVATWLQDNTLVQKSLATMGPSVWGELAALPWVTPTSSPLQGSIALRLTIDGNPGACAAPLSMATAGLDGGAFVLKSTPDCGGSGIAQHTLTCPSCRFTSDTSVSLVFDYSCQSMLLEALGSSPAYPGPLSLSIQSAPAARTAAPKAGALLTSLTWQLSPVLSVLWDNVTAANSAIGWYLADSKLTLAPPLIPPAVNDSLSILPTASSVTVTFALALSSTYSSTLLTQRVPVTQLLANIVGLSGLLAIFGIAFGSFEDYCSRKRVRGAKHTPLGSRAGGSEGAAGESGPQQAAVFAVDNPLRPGSISSHQRALSTQGSLTGDLQAQMQQEAEAALRVSPQNGAAEGLRKRGAAVLATAAATAAAAAATRTASAPILSTTDPLIDLEAEACAGQLLAKCVNCLPPGWGWEESGEGGVVYTDHCGRAASDPRSSKAEFVAAVALAVHEGGFSLAQWREEALEHHRLRSSRLSSSSGVGSDEAAMPPSSTPPSSVAPLNGGVNAWIRVTAGKDCWFLSEADRSATWSLPPGGVVVGEEFEEA